MGTWTADLRTLVPLSWIQHRYPRYLAVRCPFHRDRHASLLVFADGYQCLACGERGDVIDWLRRTRNLTYRAAAELAQQESPALPPVEPPPPPSITFDPAQIWRWHYSLTATTVAYLTDRGLTPASIIRHRLGWGSRFSLEPARIVIPCFDGETVSAIKFRRAPGSDEPNKYTRYPGLLGTIWLPDGGLGLDQARQVMITEGEFDAMIACQLGFYGVSPTGGAGGGLRWLDRLRHVPRLYTVLDQDDRPDSPGEAFGARIAQACPRVRLVRLPAKDLTDWFVAGHRDLAPYLEQADEEARRRLVRLTVETHPRH